jgi:hypothetical protein
MNFNSSTITLTFGDVAENHASMQQIGQKADAGQGFTVAELMTIEQQLNARGIRTNLYQLHTLANLDPSIQLDSAAVLVIRHGVGALLGGNAAIASLQEAQRFHQDLFNEHANLNFDKKAFMYGRVVNKHARWNLCFDDIASEPDYANRSGRVIAIGTLPLTNTIVQRFAAEFGPKAQNLKGEGNYYYNIDKCGIGWHGDTERRKVIAVRLGQQMPIYFQWYINNAQVGSRIRCDLNGGDIYIMSEKAVGCDWKRKSIYTLRHSAGANKFTA